MTKKMGSEPIGNFYLLSMSLLSASANCGEFVLYSKVWGPGEHFETRAQYSVRLCYGGTALPSYSIIGMFHCPLSLVII